MRKFSALLKGVTIASAFVAMSFSTYAQQPVKRVLLEQFTGAWCGWCTDGSVILQNILEKNPENVIAAVHHNGDGMVVTELDNALKAFVSGYPAGAINRILFSGQQRVGIDRGQWEMRANAELAKPAVVGVELTNRQYNPTTRAMSITLNANFVEAVSGDLRFNLYVIEDSVSGTGSMYDQRNFLNTQQGHPMYGKGDPIKGYQHRSVVRRMLDGPWGTQGSIPSGVTAGSNYSKTYTFTLPSGWNDKRVSLIGVVQKFGTANSEREILNAVEMSLTKAPNVYASLSVEKPSISVPRSGTATKTISVKNSNNFAYPVKFEINEGKSNLPTGWTATISPSQVNVPAGETVTATVTLNGPAEAGMASVVVSASAMPNASEGTGKSSSMTLYALSENTKYAIISGLSDGADMYSTHMNEIPALKNDAALIPYDINFLKAFTPAENFEVLILPIDYFSRGALATNSELAGLVQSAINSGKKVFIAAELEVINALGEAGAPEAQNLIKGTFGVESNGDPVLRVTANQQGQITAVNPFPVMGFAGDVIGKSMDFMVNTSSSSFAIFTDIMKKSAGSTAVPILYYDEDQTKLAGVRVEKGTSKAVYISFGLNAIANEEVRGTLFKRIMSYLTGVSTAAAGISVNESMLDYEEVKVGMTKELSVTITSNGEIPLEISSLNITGDNASSFRIIGAPALPKTLAVGETLTLTVEFAPKALGTAVASLSIAANTEMNSEVTLAGEGVQGGGSSVESFTAGALAFLDVQVGPNPATEKATASFAVNGEVPQTVTLSIVDVRGTTVHSFGTKTLAPGKYTQDINTSAFANGNYRLVVRSAEAAVQVPFVIAR